MCVSHYHGCCTNCGDEAADQSCNARAFYIRERSGKELANRVSQAERKEQVCDLPKAGVRSRQHLQDLYIFAAEVVARIQQPTGREDAVSPVAIAGLLFKIQFQLLLPHSRDALWLMRIDFEVR